MPRSYPRPSESTSESREKYLCCLGSSPGDSNVQPRTRTPPPSLAFPLQLSWKCRHFQVSVLEGPFGHMEGRGYWEGRLAGGHNTPGHTGICEHSLTCGFSLILASGAHCVLAQKRTGHCPPLWLECCEFCLESARTQEREAGKSVQICRSGVSKLLSLGHIQPSACFIYFELSLFFTLAWET